MGGYTPPPSDELQQRIQETVKLAKSLHLKTGRWPALLVLTSHPETEGEHQWLRFEVLRQGLQIADAVVEAHFPGAWYASHPRCFLAIDPYALDTVSAMVGGFYGAWMHRIYLAWDRQPSTQSWIQRHLFLHGTHYGTIAWRLLRYLKSDSPIVMALGGGLPYNARLLYAAREFVRRLPIGHWNVPRHQACLELMDILMNRDGTVWPAENGELTPFVKEKVRRAMEQWGVSPERLDTVLAEFAEEFKRSVPYRTRLFNVFMGRIVKKGKPLIVMVIQHDQQKPYVRISAPVEVPLGAPPEQFAKSLARFFN
jgi:hypothetical protein